MRYHGKHRLEDSNIFERRLTRFHADIGEWRRHLPVPSKLVDFDLDEWMRLNNSTVGP